MTVQLPSWATTGGGTYDSSGFCGSGSPTAAVIRELADGVRQSRQ